MEKEPIHHKRQGRQPLLITNNRFCAEAFSNRCDFLFEESWNYGQVLTAARDYVHKGYHLLSHPQYGSLKPNQTPYKSLLLTMHCLDKQDKFASLLLIEQALAVYDKFQNMHPTPPWPSKVLEDFRIVDLSLMQSVFERLPLIAL